MGSAPCFRLLHNAAMTRSARRAVAGDGVCIGLTYEDMLSDQGSCGRDQVPRCSNIHIAPTTIQANHNSVSAPHTDNSLQGVPSIALGVGDYSGGRLRLGGVKAPLRIRDHAVISDGRKTHSSGEFNGDRWSLVLCAHASWREVLAALVKELRTLWASVPTGNLRRVARHS